MIIFLLNVYFFNKKLLFKYMNFDSLFFFFFSSIVLTSAIFVIYSTNTIYSVFFLILVFTNSTGLLLLSEIEFISIILIIIYVGAITILFLFVIMMLDINVLIKKVKNQNFGYIPIICLISFLFSLETFIMFSKNFTTYYHVISQSFYTNSIIYKIIITKVDSITNIETLGQILYNYYIVFFLIAGIILLIALIGAVTLTKKKKKTLFINSLYQQISRNSLTAIFNTNK